MVLHVVSRLSLAWLGLFSVKGGRVMKGYSIKIDGVEQSNQIRSFEKQAIIGCHEENGMMKFKTVGFYFYVEFESGRIDFINDHRIEVTKLEEEPMNKRNKHAELFRIKLENMGLVLLSKHKSWREWLEDEAANRKESPYFMVSDNFDYFLCQKEHKANCLHWLNGGEIQGEHPRSPNSFNDFAPFEDINHWDSIGWYMRKGQNIRIKPEAKNNKASRERYSKGEILQRHAGTAQIKAGLGVPAKWDNLRSDEKEYWCQLAELIEFKVGE